jgi:hypothetical protein
VPQLNRERALKYLACCYAQGLSWEDAERQIVECLGARGVPREGIMRQLKMAKPLLQPWLDWRAGGARPGEADIEAMVVTLGSIPPRAAGRVAPNERSEVRSRVGWSYAQPHPPRA